MNRKVFQNVFLIFLAAVFTVGLTFATVELPYRIDKLIQDHVATPGLDSEVDDSSQLQTELFISHYNLRLIGYLAFAVMIFLLVIGFSTLKTCFAAAGAVTFMLPVFAQFASVMFFLSGLGILNVLWLPLLDISFDLQMLGMVIHAPYDLLSWLLGKAGINGYWYIVYFFIGGGALIFFLGTYAWLSARAGRKKVADIWIYRLSRHPQYAGWIMWSYGVYLLLLLARYPKRSWGISASLPWLLSTLFIVGVAMVEEIRMVRLSGAEYGRYRDKAPFLFPMPRFLRRLFSVPLLLIFRKKQPERKREVIAVLSIYASILIVISALFYMDGARRISSLVKPAESLESELSGISQQLEMEEGRRARNHLASRLESYGGAAEGEFLRLIDEGSPEVRFLAVSALEKVGSERAVPRLTGMLEDPDPNIRWKAVKAMGAIVSKSLPEREASGPAGRTDGTEAEADGKPAPLRETVTPLLLARLEDRENFVRLAALNSLARLGTIEVVERAIPFVQSEHTWLRSGAADALGILGSDDAVGLILPLLEDQTPYVRRRAVIALLRIGSEKACEGLKEATDDEDWETRIYASEASKRLCR